MLLIQSILYIHCLQSWTFIALIFFLSSGSSSVAVRRPQLNVALLQTPRAFQRYIPFQVALAFISLQNVFDLFATAGDYHKQARGLLSVTQVPFSAVCLSLFKQGAGTSLTSPDYALMGNMSALRQAHVLIRVWVTDLTKSTSASSAVPSTEACSNTARRLGRPEACNHL